MSNLFTKSCCSVICANRYVFLLKNNASCNIIMNTEDLQKKIKSYEGFIEDTLKNDLRNIQGVLDDNVTKYKDWEQVKQVVRTVREFKEKDSDMLIRSDIGSGVMATSEITDFERTYICIGLGYMLEMDCDEADKYSDIRLKLLKKEIDHFRKLAVNVKVHIKMVLLAINELQATLMPVKTKT